MTLSKTVRAHLLERIGTLAELLAGVVTGELSGDRKAGLKNKIVAICLQYLDASGPGA